MELTNEIKNALNSGLKFNPTHDKENKEIKSKLLDKYNNDYTEYLISEHEYNESNCNYMVIEKLKIVNRSDKTAICFDK